MNISFLNKEYPDFYHGIGYGSGFTSITAGANDMGGAYVSNSGQRTYTLTGTTCNTAGSGSSWTNAAAPTTNTPPTTAGVVDTDLRTWLLSSECAIPCCENFEPLAEPLAMVDYRYGFNGMERDDEVKGRGNSYDFGARMYDSRLGRFFAVDDSTKKYPFLSPYLFAGNKPIAAIDKNGDEEFVITRYWDASGNNYKTTIEIYNATQGPQQIYHVQDVILGTAPSGNPQYTVSYFGSFDNLTSTVPPEGAIVSNYLNNVNYIDPATGNIHVQGISRNGSVSGTFSTNINGGAFSIGGVIRGAGGVTYGEEVLTLIPDQVAYNSLPQNIQNFNILRSDNSIPDNTVAATQRSPVNAVMNIVTPAGNATLPPRIRTDNNNNLIISN